nr:MAG TPA: hypothetical protein [Caudoviricetes sp.]DAW13422.1 MAG TPA: hypothetical protein [Caudoviricetes sp.]
MVSDKTMRPSLRSVYFVLFLAMGVLLLGSCIVRNLYNQIFTIQKKRHKIEVRVCIILRVQNIDNKSTVLVLQHWGIFV